MKTTLEIDNKKMPEVVIDPELDKYKDVVLFPEKLAKANELLKKSGAPKLPKQNRSC